MTQLLRGVAGAKTQACHLWWQWAVLPASLLFMCFEVSGPDWVPGSKKVQNFFSVSSVLRSRAVSLNKGSLPDGRRSHTYDSSF